jgi:CheY-like chemotaxis protein
MGQKSCILVVDNEEKWSKLFREILEERFSVRIAQSVVEASRFIAQHAEEIAFAIVDMRLQGEHDYLGLGVLQDLALRGIPCVATTAYQDTMDVRAIRDAFVKGRARDVWFKTTMSISEVLEEASRILASNTDRRSPFMVTPIEQLEVGILLEATKFLFAELGRRLQFWREKKGKEASPKKVEPEQRGDTLVVKFDDVERSIKMEELENLQEDIEACVKRIRRLRRRLRSWEDQSTRPLRPADREDVDLNIQELNERIKEEGDKLQSMLEKVYD